MDGGGAGRRGPRRPAARRLPDAGRGGPAAGAATRYTVQVSVDGGTTWQTVGYGLTEPQVRIDRTVLGDADTVKVRVTATTGFKSVSTEKTMKASRTAGVSEPSSDARRPAGSRAAR